MDFFEDLVTGSIMDIYFGRSKCVEALVLLVVLYTPGVHMHNPLGFPI